MSWLERRCNGLRKIQVRQSLHGESEWLLNCEKEVPQKWRGREGSHSQLESSVEAIGRTMELIWYDIERFSLLREAPHL